MFLVLLNYLLHMNFYWNFPPPTNAKNGTICDDLVFTVRCVNSSACKKKVFSICYTNLLKGWKGQGRGKGREKENRREQDDQNGKGQRERARKKIS